MILNISGRTDIVAFYTPWLLNRLKEGFVDVRNPFYPKMVSRINFNDVDAFLFCTKNPKPIIPYLKEFDKPIIFHITITPYNIDIEPNVSKKNILDQVKEISNIIGKENVIVRYDPIFLNPRYDLDYHIKAFKKLCDNLNGSIEKIIVSFLDNYKNVQNNLAYLKVIPFKQSDYKIIGTNFSQIAKQNNITVQTCCENETLEEYGFIKGDCMSKELAYKLTGKVFPKWKARGNKCSCVEMVDIGAYNTCMHMCKYCYANYDERQVKINIKDHHVKSTMLIGKIESDDIIKERK